MIDDYLYKTGLGLVQNEMIGRRLSPHYQKDVNASIHAFALWCKEMGIENIKDVSKIFLVQYYNILLKEKSAKTGELLSIKTINSRFFAIRLLFDTLYIHDYLKTNPCHGVEIKHIQKHYTSKRSPFTVREINLLLESIDTDKRLGLRDRALFETMYSSGLRVCELANLKIGDIDFDQRLMVVRGKFSTDRMVPLSIVAKICLENYLGDRKCNVDEPVFIGARGIRGVHYHLRAESISYRFHQLLIKNKMDRSYLSAHSVRHSTATHLLEKGVSIRHVQELLGHKEISTTERYTHVQLHELLAVFKKYHPREINLFNNVDEDYINQVSNLLE